MTEQAIKDLRRGETVQLRIYYVYYCLDYAIADARLSRQ